MPRRHEELEDFKSRIGSGRVGTAGSLNGSRFASVPRILSKDSLIWPLKEALCAPLRGYAVNKRAIRRK